MPVIALGIGSLIFQHLCSCHFRYLQIVAEQRHSNLLTWWFITRKLCRGSRNWGMKRNKSYLLRCYLNVVLGIFRQFYCLDFHTKANVIYVALVLINSCFKSPIVCFNFFLSFFSRRKKALNPLRILWLKGAWCTCQSTITVNLWKMLAVWLENPQREWQYWQMTLTGVAVSTDLLTKGLVLSGSEVTGGLIPKVGEVTK